MPYTRRNSFRDAFARGAVRHSYDSGVVRAQRCEHHDGLIAHVLNRGGFRLQRPLTGSRLDVGRLEETGKARAHMPCARGAVFEPCQWASAWAQRWGATAKWRKLLGRSCGAYVDSMRLRGSTYATGGAPTLA